MKSLNQKRIIVTGAAGGIGKALALQLDAMGAYLVLVDINDAALRDVNKELSKQASIHAFDVSDATKWESFKNDLYQEFGDACIDGIINNAGIAHESAPVNQLDYADFDKIMQVNFNGVLFGTKTFLDDFINKPEAWVVNISSLFGIISIASLTPYCTSKFAVRGFTEGLRMEALAAFPHVKVCCVHPGGIKTEIANNAVTFGIQKEEDHLSQIGSFNTFLKTSPAIAASKIINGMQKGKARVTIGNDARYLDMFARLLPQSYAKVLVNYLDKLGVKF